MSEGETAARALGERSLLAHADAAVIAADTAARITFWNAAAAALYGLREQEALGLDLRTLGGDEAARAFATALDVALAGASWSGEVEVRRADGSAALVTAVFTPVRADGDVVGAIAVATDVTAQRRGEHAILRRVRDDEEPVLLTTARAVDPRREAELAVRESRDLLEAILGSVADAITVLAPDGRIVYANAAAAALLGYADERELLQSSSADVLSRFELLGEDGSPLPAARLPSRRVLGDGEPVEESLRYRIRATGEERYSLVRALPVRDAAGGLGFVVNVFEDVTQARRAERRLRFLAEASTLLSSSLDYEATLASLSSLVVPELADWYAVDLLDDDGALRRLALAHVDPAKAELVRAATDEAVASGRGAGRVIRDGEAVLVPEVTEELLARLTEGRPELLETLRALGLRSSIVVPLVCGGRTLGAITLASAESGRRYGDEDLELAEELALRAATAVDNARLHRETSRAAALLDSLLAAVPVGLAFLDREQRYVRVNDALAAINGLPADAHVGRRPDEIPGLDPVVHERIAHVLATGEPLLDQDEEGETPATPGERRALQVSYYPVRDAHGELLGAGVALVDVTEQRRVEAERLDLLARERRARTEAEDAVRTLYRLELVTEAALAHLSLEDLLNALLLRLVDVLEADTAAILLPDEAGATLAVRATVGLDEELELALRVPVGAGLAGRVAAERRTWVIDELDEVELVSPVLRTKGVHSLVAVPLVVEGELLGVFHVGDLRPARFGAADARLLELAADRIALAIHQSRLYEAERDARAAAQEARERLAFLAEVSDVLASSLDLDATLGTLARLAVPRLADTCAVHLAVDGGPIRTVSLVRAAAGAPVAVEQAREQALDPTVSTGVPAVIRSGRPQLVPEVDETLVERLAAERPGQETRLRDLVGASALAVPLNARGRTVGAITLVASPSSGRRYDDRDLAFAEELARRAAVAVDNALLFREAEERAQAARILQNVGDGVFLVDGDGVVRYWNRAAERITGLAAAHVVGRHARRVIPGWGTIEPLAPVGGAPQSMPLQLNDRELWLSLSGVALEEGTVYAFRDLTEERALEELKAEFVSTVSHELRTPLAAIYGAAMTLRRDDVQLGEAQRERLLAVVASEADRLARTVNDILWASRLDADVMTVAIESCDAEALVRAVVAAQQAHLPEQIRLELEVEPGLPPVAADPDKVRQVLVNLVDNAVKYSPDGGLVRVSVAGRGGQVRFAVDDEGLGIPQAEQRRIFEKFYRLDPDMNRGVGGTGLGLYICRELVRRMNGRIWVSSEPGRGSTFGVELPVAGDEDDVRAHLRRAP